MSQSTILITILILQTVRGIFIVFNLLNSLT